MTSTTPARASAQAPAAERDARERVYALPRYDLPLTIVTGLCASALVIGWALRADRLLVADRGLGYALGIVGLVAAVSLLSYSVRKRVLRGRMRGSLRPWFRVHLMLGLVAPTAVLLHGNFRFGSLNSAVALVCMLSVAASGFFGRFVYIRIHRGLFGRRRRLADVREEVEVAWQWLRVPAAREAPELAQRLAAFGSWAADPSLPLGPHVARFLISGWKARRLRRAARHALRDASSPYRALLPALDEYLATATSLTRLRACERAFAVWHAVHVPLCVLLFAAALAHVIAVHLY